MKTWKGTFPLSFTTLVVIAAALSVHTTPGATQPIRNGGLRGTGVMVTRAAKLRCGHCGYTSHCSCQPIFHPHPGVSQLRGRHELRLNGVGGERGNQGAHRASRK